MAAETIYATFQTIADAERAIGALIDHGVSRDNIGVIARQAAEQDEAERVRAGFTRVVDTTDTALGEPVVTYEPRSQTLPPAALADTLVPASSIDTPDNVETVGKIGVTTTTAADASAGAAIGTGVGLVAGLLAGAAALVVPGVGMVLAAGAVTAAIGATVATTAAGAIAGGVAGYLRDMGMDETAATSYADRISQGDYLIAITIDTADYDAVRRILLKYNAAGVDTQATVAGGDLRRAWGNDAALATYVQQPPAQVATPPLPRVAAHDLNGEPIIATEEIEQTPAGVSVSRLPDRSPAESADALDAESAFDPELNNR